MIQFWMKNNYTADDLTAKWSFATLFVSNLKLPTYFETDQIYSVL